MKIFKAYDVRGEYPEELNEDVSYKIGRAFADFLEPEEVVIGRDMRMSSPNLFKALSKGITEQGTDVISVGVVSTPMLYYAVNELNADGGVMITASHNPKGYNGFKFVKKRAEPISEETGLKEIQSIIEYDTFTKVPEQGVITEKNLLEDYVQYVRGFSTGIKDLKVVSDCGNGMAGKTIRAVLEDFPIENIFLFEEPDGDFPNHEANPSKPENTKELQEKVVEEEADIGFAFDGDADRVYLIDEEGERIRGDITTALIAKQILKENEGAEILYEVRSSKAVPELIKELGGKPVISRPGHSLIKAKMIKEDILFGGESSGHYFYKENFYTDSAAITVMKVLSLLCEKKKPVSELISNIIKYYHTREINFKVEDKKQTLAEVEEYYEDDEGVKITHVDGVTVEFPNWWFNLRESNTEPVIRLNLEADTEELMKEKLKEVKSLIE